jgi:hypothetical protein
MTLCDDDEKGKECHAQPDDISLLLRVLEGAVTEMILLR